MRSSVVKEPCRTPARKLSCCSRVWFRANSTLKRKREGHFLSYTHYYDVTSLVTHRQQCTHERTLHLFTHYKHSPSNMIFSFRSGQILHQHTQTCCINSQFPKQQVWERANVRETGNALLNTALSPGSKGRKFTAPIKIKCKPSLERIYGVQQPQTTATLQLSQTHGLNLKVPPTPLSRHSWLAESPSSGCQSQLSILTGEAWKWEEREFVLLFCMER